MPPKSKIPRARKPKAEKYAVQMTDSPTQNPYGEVSTVLSYLFTQNPYPYNPDELVGKKGLQIYTKMMQDEQVKAAMTAKQFAVISAGWEIEPADFGEEEKQQKQIAEEIAKFVEFNFEQMPGSFDAKILEMLSALGYGFSIAEKIWQPIDDPQYEGKIGLSDLKFRHPHGIEFEMDAYGNLLKDGIRQARKQLPADKFFVYTYRRKFSNMYGDSDLRAAYRPYWIKDSLSKFMCIAMERYGEPTWVFTQDGPTSNTNRNLLKQFMQDLQTKSGLILPSTITADPKYPAPRAGEAFVPVLEWCDEQIRLALLMPGLIGFGSSRASQGQNQGSYARAETEDDSFMMVVTYTRGDSEVAINEQLIRPLVDLNFEITDGKYPKFKFKAVTAEEEQRQIENYIKALYHGAVTKTREDENKMRDLIEFPQLPDDVPITDPNANPAGASTLGPDGMPEVTVPNINGPIEKKKPTPAQMQREFAGEDEKKGHWVTIDGHPVYLAGEGSGSQTDEKGRWNKSGDQGNGVALLYHGTNGDRATLSSDKAGQRDFGNLGVGVYLSDSPELADRYAQATTEAHGGTPHTLNVVAHLTKTFDFGNKHSLAALSNATGVSFPISANDKSSSAKVAEYLTGAGYDSGKLGSEYVVYNSAKIHVHNSVQLPAGKHRLDSPEKERALKGKLDKMKVKGTALNVWFSRKESEYEHKDFAASRALTKYEKRVDFAKTQEVLDKSESQAAKKMRGILKDELKRIENWVDLRKSSLSPDTVATLKVDTGAAMRLALRDLYLDTWRDGRDLAVKELPGKVANSDAVKNVRRFDASLAVGWEEIYAIDGREFAKVRNPLFVPSWADVSMEAFWRGAFVPEAIKGYAITAGFEPQDALNAFSARSWLIQSVIDTDLQNRVRYELFEYLRGGRTLLDTINNIRHIFEPWVGNPERIRPSGVTGTGEDILQAYRIENIVRTEGTFSFNAGRVSVGDAAGDYVIGYQFSAIIDQRNYTFEPGDFSTAPCRLADGLILRAQAATTVRMHPPLHWNCRSLLTYVTTDDGQVEFASQAEIDKVLQNTPREFR